MGKVVELPKRRNPDALAWICGCGGAEWVLYADGDCLCVGCNCISTVITVVRASGTANGADGAVSARSHGKAALSDGDSACPEAGSPFSASPEGGK